MTSYAKHVQKWKILEKQAQRKKNTYVIFQNSSKHASNTIKLIKTNV